MSITLVSPQFSFVQFDNTDPVPSCIGDAKFLLPISNENDLAFQFKIVTDTVQESIDVLATPLTNIALVVLKGTNNTSGTIVANTARNYLALDGKKFIAYRTGKKEITFVWVNGLPLIQNYIYINLSACFQLCVIATFTSGEETVNINAFSNGLKLISPDSYTSILEYNNDEDSYDFRYCNVPGYLNKTRLPFYLNQPQFIDTKSVYRKSTGQRVVTSSVTDKEYSVLTNAMPESIHEKFELALNHDNVNVESSRYSGGVYMDGAYNIDWDDPKDCTAPADLKVYVTPYYAVNDNCEECNEIDITCPLLSDAVSVLTVPGSSDPDYDPSLSQLLTVSFTIPDGITGVNIRTSLTGADVWTDHNLPAVTPSKFNLAAGNYDIQVIGKGDCTPTEIDFENVSASCAGVELVIGSEMPDGTVAVPYTYSFTVTGDAPFAIGFPTGHTQPIWMSITINNTTKTVTLAKSSTGTQTAGAYEVKFSVTNCDDEFEQIFDDSFVMS